MTDIVSRKKRSEIMSRIRSKHTGPELLLRKSLRELGYAYRLHYGKHMIDIAFPREHVALFVDGCFWHKCPKHFRLPKSNRAFWRKKISGNAKRDVKETRILRREGWKVIRVWEHSLGKNAPAVAKRVGKTLVGRRQK